MRQQSERRDRLATRKSQNEPFVCRSCGATSDRREPCLNHEDGRFPIMVPTGMVCDSLQAELDALKAMDEPR